MQKILTTLLILIAVNAEMASQDPINNDYEAWKVKHQLSFNYHEDRYRQFLYRQTQAQIRAHNQNSQNTWKKEQNQFSALTSEEFKNLYLGLIVPPEVLKSIKIDNSEIKKKQQPKLQAVSYVDWVQNGIVTSIKNQGSCGSCWAFSSVAAIQSAYLQKYNKKLDLSEQHLIDCTYAQYDADGCKGGWMRNAYNYIKLNDNGIQLESERPYKASFAGCPSDGLKGDIKIKGYMKQEMSCGYLRGWLTMGPLTVCVDASTWPSYKSGVHSACSQKQSTYVNHAVLLVGFDIYGNWKVKNSWGTNWGSEGYITLDMNKNCNICVLGGQLPVI